MASVSTFMYCDSVQNQNGNMTVNSPMQIITPKYVPGMFSFSVFFGILDINQNEEHKLRFVFKKENGMKVIDTGEIQLPKNENHNDIPKDMQGFMASMEFRNTNFDSEGMYFTEIYIDSEKLGEYPIKVKVIRNE